MIYTLNARDYILYPVAKSCLQLSDDDVHTMILEDFALLKRRLKMKDISYEKLKRALIPNQDVDKNEICLVFDTEKIDSSSYGYQIFENLIPLFDKESTYSIIVGDYVDDLRGVSNSQIILRDVLDEVIVKYGKSRYIHSNQYFLVYINSISAGQLDTIIVGLSKHDWFYGVAKINHMSKFKTYISTILPPLCIKNRNHIITRHTTDCADDENMKLYDYPFEYSGFKVSSINEDSYSSFLCYKIESILPDEEDIGFSFNAILPKFDSVRKLKLDILDAKWGYVTNASSGKGELLRVLGYVDGNKEKFLRDIYKEICQNYIYNLRMNEYGDAMFNVCIELSTVNERIRKTTIALKYLAKTGEISLVTIT